MLWQTAIPIGLGLTLATAIGMALDATLLKMTGRPVGVDWTSVLSMTGIATAVVLLVTVLSLPPLLRLMRPDGLRTEYDRRGALPTRDGPFGPPVQHPHPQRQETTTSALAVTVVRGERTPRDGEVSMWMKRGSGPTSVVPSHSANCRDWMALPHSLTDPFGIMPAWTSTSPRQTALARCGSV